MIPQNKPSFVIPVSWEKSTTALLRGELARLFLLIRFGWAELDRRPRGDKRQQTERNGPVAHRQSVGCQSDGFQSDAAFPVFRDGSDTAGASDVDPVIGAHVIQNAEGDDFVLIKGAEKPVAGTEVRHPVCSLFVPPPGGQKDRC